MHPPPRFLLRITADTPFLDPALGRTLALAWMAHGRFGLDPDYLAPCYPPPDCADGGLDIEAVSYAALLEADHHATDPLDREHATRFIWRQPDKFICLKHDDPPGYGTLGINWMCDTPADLVRLTRIARWISPGETGWVHTQRAEELARGLDTLSLPG